MFSRHGPTASGCLVGILACSTLISAVSANDVNMSMFDCHLCKDYMYCASRFVATVMDIACDKINMNRSLVFRNIAQTTTTCSVLEECGFPLPGVDGRSGYWIMRSVRSSVGNLIHNISNHYIDQYHNGGQFPYICEENVGLGWTEIDGRLYRRTHIRHTLCNARKICEGYGAELCTMEGTNLTQMVLELGLAHLMPVAIWVNTTGNTCTGPISYVLHLLDDTTSRYEVALTKLNLYALCEKRFGVNRDSSSGPTVSASNPPPATAATPTIAVLSTVATVTPSPQISTVSPMDPPHMSTVETTNPAPSSTVAVTKQSQTSTAAQTSGWIMDSPREFYVNRNQSNFTAATESCRSTLNASMVFFTDPLKYLDMSQTLGLTPGHFWVGVAVNDSHHKCLQLRVGQNNDAFLSRADCRQMAASICSRTSNVSDVLENPVFTRLLADMKVDSSETQKSKRKLVSVHDERKSALAVGSIGVIAFISVFTLIALLDLTRLKCRCKYDDSKKTKVKVVRARKASERASSGPESTC